MILYVKWLFLHQHLVQVVSVSFFVFGFLYTAIESKFKILVSWQTHTVSGLPLYSWSFYWPSAKRKTTEKENFQKETGNFVHNVSVLFRTFSVFTASSPAFLDSRSSQTGTPIPWPHPQRCTCERSLQCVLTTACAIALKDMQLTATGHCSPGTGWHTLMNDAALAASATALSLTHEDT